VRQEADNLEPGVCVLEKETRNTHVDSDFCIKSDASEGLRGVICPGNGFKNKIRVCPCLITLTRLFTVTFNARVEGLALALATVVSQKGVLRAVCSLVTKQRSAELHGEL
jgi:hypothetical protein